LLIWCYLCRVIKEKKKVLRINQFSKRENTKDVIMEMKRTNDIIEMLQYQLKRYKAMRKGAACQSLQYKLHKLMSQQANA